MGDLMTPQGVALTSRLAARLERAQRAANRTLLLDVSASMENPDAEGGRRRIEVLLDAVRNLPFRPGAIVAFSGSAALLPDPQMIPDRGQSNTNLAEAFAFVKRHGLPRDVVLVTDGEPDSERDALREAQGLRVSVIFAGRAGEPPEFVRRLTAATGGEEVTVGFKLEQIENSIRGLLEAPAR